MKGLFLKLLRMFGVGASERDIDEELRFHVDMETEALVRQGLSRAEARRRALIAFGGEDRYREETREARGTRWLEEGIRDARFGLRSLARSPGFALSALSTLALGVGATTAIYSIVQGVVLAPLPYPESDRLVTVWMSNPAQGYEKDITSWPRFTDWREQSSTVSPMVTVRSRRWTLTGEGDPESVPGAVVSRGFFEMLGSPLALGRPFRAGEVEGGLVRVTVLSHELWTRRFGGDPAIVGRTILLDDEPWEVVGVARPGQRYPRDVELWVPQSFDGPYAPFREARGTLWLPVVGRLADGVSIEAAQAEMNEVAERLREAYPGVDDGLGITLEPLRTTLLGDARTPLLVLLGAVALVLLIAVVNVANLLLVRGTARTRELALRLTLGAGRGRVVRQVLAEGLMLGAIGGALGAAVAAVAVRTLVRLAPAGLPRLDELGVSPGLFGAALGISLLATLLFSLAPALHVGGVEPAERLGGGQRTTIAARVVQARSVFVVGQFTLALVLLVGAGLLLRSFARLQAVDPGFDPHGVLSASLLLPASRYADGDAVRLFMQRLDESARGVPGVEKTGTIGQFFMPGGSSAIRLEGEPDFTDDAVRNPVLIDQASPGFFEAAGMRLLEGRPLSDTDRPGAPLVAVVNRAFVVRFMPDGDPLGRRFTWGTTDSEGALEWFTVVGVVADAHRSGLSEPVRPTAFRSAMQQPDRQIEILLRTGGDPATLASGLREAVRAIDPELPVTALRTLDQAMSDALSARRFVMLLLVAFAMSAAALAAVGIYGVTAYVVGRRTREIGIRMTLGAEPRTVVGDVLRQGVLQAAVGVALGSIAALGLTRYLRSQLFALEPTDPTTYAAAVAALLVIAGAACVLPARRAARVDAVFALKED